MANPLPPRLPQSILPPQIADFRFNAVNVGSGGGATFDFDELRIGATFSVVAPLAPTFKFSPQVR